MVILIDQLSILASTLPCAKPQTAYHLLVEQDEQVSKIPKQECY